MKTRNFTLLFLLLALTSLAQAQVKLGFKGGYNVSTATFLFQSDFSENPRVSSIALTQAIFPVELVQNDHYSFQPELHFKQTGNRINTLERDYSNIINYWGLGLMNKFKLETKQITPYALLGLQLNAAVSGKINYIDRDTNSFFGALMEEKIAFEDLGLNRFDTNIRIGFGLTASLSKAELLLEFTYDKGLLDMNTQEDLSAFNAKGLGILIGIMKTLEAH